MVETNRSIEQALQFLKHPQWNQCAKGELDGAQQLCALRALNLVYRPAEVTAFFRVASKEMCAALAHRIATWMVECEIQQKKANPLKRADMIRSCLRDYEQEQRAWYVSWREHVQSIRKLEEWRAEWKQAWTSLWASASRKWSKVEKLQYGDRIDVLLKQYTFRLQCLNLKNEDQLVARQEWEDGAAQLRTQQTDIDRPLVEVRAGWFHSSLRLWVQLPDPVLHQSAIKLQKVKKERDGVYRLHPSYVRVFLQQNQVREQDVMWTGGPKRYYGFGTQMAVGLTPGFLRKWQRAGYPALYRYEWKEEGLRLMEQVECLADERQRYRDVWTPQECVALRIHDLHREGGYQHEVC